MEVTFRWAQRDDIPLIRRFLSENFDPGSIQAAPGRFEAVFLDHPRGLHVTACFAGGSMVGARFHLPVRIDYGKNPLPAAFAVDMMVNAEYRRRGIGQRFMEMALERFPATLSTGQSPANRALYGKLGVSASCGFQQAFLVRRPRVHKSLKSTGRDFIAWGLRLGKKIPHADWRKISSDSAADLAVSLPSRLASGESGSMMERTDFSWRYSGRFYNDCYMVLVEWEGSRGLLVTRQAGGETRIIDAFCAADGLGTLLRIAGHVLPGERLTAVFAGKRLKETFSSAGFLVRPVDANLVVSSSDPALLGELNSRNWLLFGGDSDTELRYFPHCDVV